jgi:flagellar basal body-associated protein FliL
MTRISWGEIISFERKGPTKGRAHLKAVDRASVRSGENFRKAPEKTPKRKMGKTAMLLIFALLIIVCVVTWLYVIQPRLASAPPPKEEVAITEDFSVGGYDFIVDKDKRNILHIHPPFSVVLSGLNGRWVMLFRIWLEADNAKVLDELNNYPAQFYKIADDVVTTVSSWTYAELNFGNGMNRLKEQLRTHINQYIHSGEIIRVLFQEVQFHENLPRLQPENK